MKMFLNTVFGFLALFVTLTVASSLPVNSKIVKDDFAATDGASFPLQLDLAQLKDYLNWVTRFGDANFVSEIIRTGSDILYLPNEVQGVYDRLMNEAQDFFEADTLYDDFIDEVNKIWQIFYPATDKFWHAWLDDDQENIEAQFKEYMTQLEPMLSGLAAASLKLDHKVVDYAQVFLAPEPYQELASFVNETLITLDNRVETLRRLLNGSWPMDKLAPPGGKSITLPEVVDFIRWVGKLNAGGIISSLNAATKKLRQEGDQFKTDFLAILLQAGGQQLENEGKVIFDSHTQFYEGHLQVIRSMLRQFLTLWYDGELIGALQMLESLFDSIYHYFARVPLNAVGVIEKLELLVLVLPPEHFQNAQVLRDSTLERVDQIVREYLDNWRPE